MLVCYGGEHLMFLIMCKYSGFLELTPQIRTYALTYIFALFFLKKSIKNQVTKHQDCTLRDQLKNICFPLFLKKCGSEISISLFTMQVFLVHLSLH